MAEKDSSAPTPSQIVDDEATQATRMTSAKNGDVKARDVALVLAARNGDTAAFRQLYSFYHQRALSLAYNVVKDPEEARDIVQEAFIRVFKNLSTFEGTASFYTWLYRIVMNLSIDHNRKVKRVRMTDYNELSYKDSDQERLMMTPSRQNDQNPRRSLLRNELIEKIQASLDEMPEYHRLAIVLREVDGLSYEEIAEVLNVPRGTIMSRLFHARKKMKEALEGYLDEELDLEN